MGYRSFYARHVKAFIDIFLALLGIGLFWWLYIIIAIAIKIDDPGGPVIFRQERLGRQGKVYQMYKFRSMKVGAEKGGVYSDDYDPRITRVGLFLRRTSLDEIPQLVNILKGDMSWIGFRSPLTYHPWPWSQYSDQQKYMFVLKPGITGWAQVHGRKTLEWDQRIKYNCWYADHVSFFLDLWIVLLTIIKILRNVDNENQGATVKK